MEQIINDIALAELDKIKIKVLVRGLENSYETMTVKDYIVNNEIKFISEAVTSCN